MRIFGQRPLVSFIVSVFNVERYIGACLNSIITQPFDDYEIILVNNNSTDGSDAICREYAAHHKQIRYYALTEAQPFNVATWRLIFSRKLRERYRTSVKHVKTPAYIYHDVYVSIRTLLSARSVYYVDTPIYLYRVRSSSISRITAAGTVSECSKLLLSLEWLMRCRAKTEQERGFIRVYMEQFRYQLVAALCIVSKQITESAAEIDKYVKQNKRKGTATPLGDYSCSVIDTLLVEGAAAGLARLRVQYFTIVEQIVRMALAKGGDIYLAPTGHIGLYLKTAFETSGLSVSGFFDNDVQKDGMLADGIPVRLPVAVKEIDSDKPITILIGSEYQNVREELRRQFIVLGIDESDLFIIEF